MRLIYLGNRAGQFGKSASVQDELTPLFALNHQIVSVSGKKNKVLRLLDMMAILFRYGKKSDVVLIDTYSTINFYYAYLAGMYCHLLKIKFTLFLHGGDLPLRIVRTPRLSKQLFSRATALVAPSGFMQSAFNKHNYYPVVIPNMLVLKNYNFNSTQREFDVPRLLWVRNFRNHYNPIMALQTLLALKRHYPLVSLTMVGPIGEDSSYQDCMKFINEHDLASSVNLTGRLNKADWINLSTQCNIFINTTNVDNTPVSVIEAMALGLPVISTNVGGIPFLLEDEKDALLVESNSTEQMVEAVLRLLNNPEFAQQIAANARIKVEKFDWEVVQHQWEKLFSDVAKG